MTIILALLFALSSLIPGVPSIVVFIALGLLILGALTNRTTNERTAP